MKQMKRAFAMLLCVAMVLSLCTMFAGAAVSIYGPYATLDDIPEDVNIFRSIRTGQYYYLKNDDCYEFYEEGFPRVRIKRSAFMTQPTNAYLTADQDALSRNCKNVPSEALADGGTSRVCYYKTMRVNSFDIPNNGETKTYYQYTVSMYRLELKANAYRELNDRNVYIQAKLTSGVSFVYDTLYPPEYFRALTRQDKIPIRPSVSVSVSDNPAIEYQIMNGFAPYSDVSLGEVLQTLSNAVGCASNVVALIAPGEVIEKVKAGLDAASNCSAVIGTIVKHSTDHGYHSDTVKTWEKTPIVISPVKLTHSDNFVEWRLKFRNDISDKNLKIEFKFV